MAQSRCSKCDNTTFESKEAVIENFKEKIQFIQCKSCGAVVGVSEIYTAAKIMTDCVNFLLSKLGK